MLFVFTYAALQIVMLGNIKQMENENCVGILEGIQKNMKSQSDSFLRTNRDWSSWDETYNFVQGQYPEYEAEQLTPSTLENLEIYLFLILDVEGNVYYVNSYGSPEWTNTALQEIRESDEFLANDSDWTKEGYTSIAGQNILLAANPILTSNNEGPLQGTLIWGKVISEHTITDLLPISGTTVLSNWKLDSKVSVPPNDIELQTINDSYLLGQVMVRPSVPGLQDINLEATFTRTIYQQSLKAINGFLSTFIVIVAILEIVIFKVTDYALIVNIEAIGSQVAKLDPNKTLRHITFKRKNELVKFVDGVNMLLDEIEKYKVKLQENERLATIGQTASMVGHDLRNPLQTITLMSYLFRQKLLGEIRKPTPIDVNKLEHFLDIIDEQTLYMDKIVGDIQSYAGGIEPRFVKANILEIAQDSMSASNIPDNIQARVEMNVDIPQIDADPLVIKRVFTNLISNATHAMPNGGHLSVYATRGESDVTVSVEDTGEGIPDADLPKLFKPFYTTKAKGAGLGLAASKRIIDSHKGTIAVESKVGAGTRFYFTLPLSQQTQENAYPKVPV